MPQRNFLSCDNTMVCLDCRDNSLTFCTVAKERWSSMLDMGSSITTTVSARLGLRSRDEKNNASAKVFRSPALSEFRNDGSPGVLVLLARSLAEKCEVRGYSCRQQ